MHSPKKARTPRAERIFQLRSQLGLDQIAFAERINVDQGTVSKWENDKGIPGRPAYRLMAQLAPANSDLQRELMRDGGFLNANRRLREINRDKNQQPDPQPRWDPELLGVVIEALNKKLGVKTGSFSDREYAEKVIFYYELCHKMKTEDPAMVERFLKTA
jgi:transcriptional regulator with XRE-family HTH domain